MFVGSRDLWLARGRFALMTAVVALVALLVVMLSGLTAGLAAENTSAVEDLGATHIVFQDTVDGPSFDQSRIDVSSVSAWASRPEVTAAVPLGVSRAGMTAGDADAPVVVFGTDAAGFVAPHGLDRGDALVVGTSLAADLDLSVGDDVAIGDATFVVAATVDDTSFAHSPVVWMGLSEWSRITGSDGTVTAIALDATGEIDAAAPVAGTVAVGVADSLGAIGSFSEENGSLQMIGYAGAQRLLRVDRRSGHRPAVDASG